MNLLSETEKEYRAVDPYAYDMASLCVAYPDLYGQIVETNGFEWFLAHGTPEWEEISVAEKVELLGKLAGVGIDPEVILADALLKIHVDTIVLEGDTPWKMAGRGFWALLIEARRQNVSRIVRPKKKGVGECPIPLTREMLWKDIEIVGGICSLLKMDGSSTEDAFVVNRIRLLDSTKRAGWSPEDLLAYAMEKLAKSYRDDKPGKDWFREAGKTMGRLFEWALLKRAA